MSALHRQMLKRQRTEPSADDGHAAATAGVPSAGRSSTPSALAESPSASADPPTTTPASGNASSSTSQPDGTFFAAPEGGDQEAELGNGVADGNPAMASARGAAHAAQAVEAGAPPAPPTEAFLAADLQQRLAAMFLAGPGAPRPSRVPPVAEDARLWLLVAVKYEAHEFWKAHERQARSCCEPSLLSETEVRGYLANDALGNPLLPPGYGAHCPDAVGKRVSNGVVKATKEETAARKAAKEAARAAARKGGAVDADAAEKAAQAALAAKYDLQLPGVGRRVQHKTPALMSPHELAMAGLDAPEQTLEQLQQAVEQAVQHLKVMQAEYDGAEAAEAGQEAANARAFRAYRDLPWDAAPSMQERYEARSDVASERWHLAMAASEAAFDELQEAEEALVTAREAEEEARCPRNARSRLSKAMASALLDQMAAMIADSIDETLHGDRQEDDAWTWEKLDMWLETEKLDTWPAPPSRFRSRVSELFEILMEHPKSWGAPEFVVAAAGPSAELRAARAHADELVDAACRAAISGTSLAAF